MNTLYIDTETFSTVSIKAGTYRYAEGAELLLFAFAMNDSEPEVIDVTENPGDLDSLMFYVLTVWDEFRLVAHNSQFDRIILGKDFEGYHWCDTMVRALQHGLPGGLEMLSNIFKLGENSKDKEGKKLINLFCKPLPGGKGRATRLTHPKEWAKFKEYARQDIKAMRLLDKKIPTWNDSKEERKVWLLDQKINDRGFAVDLDLTRSALVACEKEKIRRDAATKEKTGGAVNAATQRDAMLKHLLEVYGVELPDMQIGTLERRLADPDLPDPVKELIALRLASAGTSTRKYQTLLDSVSKDGRLRGTLQYCGASRTGRWAGRIFQPQNLPRPKFKKEEIDMGIELMKHDAADLVFDSVTDLASSALRGAIVAPEGKKLVVADLSSIEGRVLAWLAGEEWKLDAYRKYDAGLGPDLYVLTYAMTFAVDYTEVSKAERQLGKVLELALGYGGGVGAFITFANGYGVDLELLANSIWDSLTSETITEAESFWCYCEEKKKTLGLTKKVFVACDAIKRLWRRANPNITSFWGNLEGAVHSVMNGADRVTVNKVVVDRQKAWLRVKLPSGRYICYAGAGVEDGTIKYLGVNQYSRKWGKLSTYSGRLAENATQGVARDIIAHGMLLAEDNGYEVVLSIHDELLTETPDNENYSSDQLVEIMSTNPEWARGLPLAAAGFECKRYRKD